MEQDQQRAQDADEQLAQVDQPPGPGKGRVRLAGAHLGAHQHGGGVGEARKEADDQPLQGAEHRQGGDGLLRLAAQDDVDHHVAHADQHLVAEDGEAFPQVIPDEASAPAEVPPHRQQIAVAAALGQDDNHTDVDQLGDHRGQGGAAHAQGRRAEVAENQHPVQTDVGADGRDGAVQRNLHAVGAAQQGRHGHREHGQRIGKADDPQILHADGLDGRLVRVQAHDRLRAQDRQQAEGQAHGHHAGQRQAVGAVDAAVVLGAPVLGEEQHAAADKAPVAAEHQGRELRAEAHRADLRLAEGRNHHRVDHGPGGGQQILQRDGNGDHRHPAQESFPVKAS